MKRLADGLAAWLVAGAIGWAGIAWIGWTLWQSTPPHAGFDLALLLDAARRVTAGASPYDPRVLAGTSPDAVSLFYSYPPPVAQALTLVAWLPDGVVLVLWAVGATLGLGLAAWRIALAAGRSSPAFDAVKAVAVAPLILPFAVGVLFGNLDVWYGVAFGVLALGVALPNPTRGRAVAAGIALGVVAVAKLHPASLLVWLMVRAFAERSASARRALVAAVATGLVLVVASVLVGGTAAWSDYLAVLRAGTGSAVVDPRNIAPVSLLGQVVPLDATAVRVVQLVVALAALAATALAAIRVGDPLASLAIAVTASLVILPVTWYHYPVALMPLAIALAALRPAARARIAVSAVVADLAIGFVPLLWVGVATLVHGAVTGDWAQPSGHALDAQRQEQAT